MTGGRPIAFIGDSHLLPEEDTVDAFLDLLEAAPARFSRLVLVGDIFDLWIARRQFHDEHHRRVLERFSALHRAGFPIDYAVGNRDYAVESLTPRPFDRVASELLQENDEAPDWLAEHGDLINEDDRQYRAWRRFSRSWPVLGLACQPHHREHSHIIAKRLCIHFGVIALNEAGFFKSTHTTQAGRC